MPDKQKSTTYNFRLPVELYNRLKEKAGFIPLPVVIRRLIERYVENEIELEDER